MNKTIEKYINRHVLFEDFIDAPINEEVELIVVIPSYNETNILSSLDALAKCKKPKGRVEVIVSINASENDPEEVMAVNYSTYTTVLNFKGHEDWLRFYPILNNELPVQKAGVGLGRKIGLDEGLKRFLRLRKYNGILVCFDADSQCDENYFVAIQDYFQQTKFESASIYYEHPLEGNHKTSVYTSIIQYELHLRYFILMQQRYQLPYAYHTVGSSMACTCKAYVAIGGMNTRKAGEDFYFIHKLIKYGRHSELNSTRVIPSPRISDRVPFGTGKAIGDMLNEGDYTYYTYDPRSFEAIGVLKNNIEWIYNTRSAEEINVHVDMKSYLFRDEKSVQKTQKAIGNILDQSKTFASFEKSFWEWFDAFNLMKYLHFIRDKKYPAIPVVDAVNMAGFYKGDNAESALTTLREIEKSKIYSYE